MKDLGEFLRLAEIENNGEMGVGIAFMGGQGTPATPDEGTSNITDVTKSPGGPSIVPKATESRGTRGPGGPQDNTTNNNPNFKQNPNSAGGHGKITTQDIPVSNQGQEILPALNSWYTSSVHHHFGINDDYEDTDDSSYDL